MTHNRDCCSLMKKRACIYNIKSSTQQDQLMELIKDAIVMKDPGDDIRQLAEGSYAAGLKALFHIAQQDQEREKEKWD